MTSKTPRLLHAEPLSREAFAPFGMVLDSAGLTPELINDGTTRRYADIAALDLRGGEAAQDDGDPRLGIYVANARAFPLPILRLERHQRASQVFIPLNGQRFVVLVAPAQEADKRVPDWPRLRAFITAPGQALSLHRNCWHHGLVALGDNDRFIVIEGGRYRNDTHEVAAPEQIVLAAPHIEP